MGTEETNYTTARATATISGGARAVPSRPRGRLSLPQRSDSPNGYFFKNLASPFSFPSWRMNSDSVPKGGGSHRIGYETQTLTRLSPQLTCSPKTGPGGMRVSEALRGQETNHEAAHG